MSGWVAGAIVVGAGVSAYSAKKGAESAAEASRQAATTQAGSQTEALEYLKEVNKLPQQYKEAALSRLAGLSGLEGGVGSQQQMIEEAIQSPLYQSIMGGREAGEEAILRSASATGGLRSGGVKESLYDYNTQLQNQALLESYNQRVRGLTGLAGTPTGETAIARGTSGIGQTLAQGELGVATAQQFGQQQQAQIFSGALEQLAPIAAKNFSDRRLKKNLKKVCEVAGFNWYTWDWNIVANKMGLSGSSHGVLADEIHDTNPECISIKNMFMLVDYDRLLGGKNA